MSAITRFAPSPTGYLHVGNAFAALCCAAWAEQHSARLLLRIEDIDHTRCQPRYTNAINEDLHWLGIAFDGAIRKQSQHLPDYAHALHTLQQMGVIYPCFCTRTSIIAELAHMGGAPHTSDHPQPYPGTCKKLSLKEQQQRMLTQPFAWRMDMQKALQIADTTPSWLDEQGNRHTAALADDIIIGRKQIGYSYQLAVVVDDAAQGITHVIRGEDLYASTAIQRLLQLLLGLPAPRYIHHPLICTADGERLAKRNASTTLCSLRQLGIEPERLQHYLLRECNHRWPFRSGDETAIMAELTKPTTQR